MLASEMNNSVEITPFIFNKNLVIYAGTLESYQGIDLLIEAFSSVVAADPEAFLLVVGGTKEQAKHFSELASECGLSQHSLFTGRVAQSLAQQYANRAKVQVSPRRSGTNTPLKVYQQLASKVPIVATRIYSHTQVLDDDVCFLVEPEPKDLARGILDALSDEQEAKRKALNARKLYEQKYSREVYTDKMVNLLEFVTASPLPGSQEVSRSSEPKKVGLFNLKSS